MNRFRHAHVFAVRRIVPSVALALLTLLPLGAAQPGAAPAIAPAIAFENVRVFDGERLLPATTVVVEDGLVASVGGAVPAGAERIDGSGATLLPGLIDAHVHAFERRALEQAAVFGVTTALDMFTDEGFAGAMRAEQAASGATDRADLFSAGTLATAPGGHGTQFGLPIDTLSAPADAPGWVAERVAAGADWIKIVIEDGEGLGFTLPSLDAATVAAVVDAAHAEGLLAVTHVQTLDAARTALEAGSDGLAHMFSDEVPDDAFVTLAAERGAFVIATLPVFQSIGASDPVDATLAGDPALAPYLSAADLQSLTAPYRGSPTLSVATAREGLARLHAAGVPVLAGSDAPNPGTAFGASLHRELELLVASGLSPSEALASATSVPARVFGLGDRGRVAPGLRADLLLVAGDPTADVTATRDIVGVWKGGVPIDRAAYRAALDARRAAAAEQADMLGSADVVPVDDFEAGELAAAFGSGWTPSTDAMAGGDSTVTLDVVDGGADGGAHALRIAGEIGGGFAFPWAGAMFMPGAEPFAAADLSRTPTLSFLARGEGGPYRVQLFCANLGQIPPETAFEVGPEWAPVEIALGEVGGCDPAQLQAVIFSAGQPGEFAFEIDEVAFR